MTTTQTVGEADAVEGRLVLRVPHAMSPQVAQQLERLPGYEFARGTSRFKVISPVDARAAIEFCRDHMLVTNEARRMMAEAPPLRQRGFGPTLGLSTLSDREWRLPVVEPDDSQLRFADDLEATLTRALRELEIPSRVERTLVGPTTVRFELDPEDGVRMRDFTALGRPQDIAFALEAESVRIQAPIPGKRLVGMEITAPEPRVVTLGEVVHAAQAPLTTALGVTPDCETVAVDVARLPHLLVAGGTGAGKSTLLHTLICSLLACSTPDELRLVLIDPKRVELRRYRGIPHLAFDPIVESNEAITALEGLVDEAERRYKLLEAYDAQNLEAYNAQTSDRDRLPAVLCVVDELADLMRRSPTRVEWAVERLGQLGRACGLHVVLATQAPQRKVLSGNIKQNVSARVALRTAEAVDSRVAIDSSGAEKLRGKGDALLRDGASVGLRRFQTAYTDDQTIEEIVDHWRKENDIHEQPTRQL